MDEYKAIVISFGLGMIAGSLGLVIVSIIGLERDNTVHIRNLCPEHISKFDYELVQQDGDITYLITCKK